MKRILLLLLAVLMLAGCAKKAPPEPTTPPSPTENTNDIYVPDSVVEQQTEGAVTNYALPTGTWFGISEIGNNLLLTGEGNLLVLSGEKGEAVATQENEDITATTVMDTATTGMAYYQANNRRVIILNPQLHNVTKVNLPKTIVGMPVISLGRNEVYYSTGNEIRALNITTNISRLIRQQTETTQTLLGACFDQSALLIQFADAEENTVTEYISAETGQTLGSGEGVFQMLTYEDTYISQWQNSSIEEWVYGIKGSEPTRITVPQPTGENSGRAAVPKAGGVVDYVETEGGLELSFYDLKAGKRAAKVTLPDAQAPVIAYGDGTYIWILAVDAKNTAQTLYRWDIRKTPVEEEETCLGKLYTPQNPDTEGLALSRKQADAYEKQYGVKILLWEDAVKHNGGYQVTPEHHPDVINATMEKLIPVLEQYPQRFLQKTVEAGWIRIALVADVQGQEWTSFWEDGDYWILLPVESDVKDFLLRGIAYAIDSHILGNSRDYDTWNEMNPEGYVYSYSDTVEESPLCQPGEEQAFTDAVAMAYPHEDRCRIFYHAMQPENGEMFTAPVMQEKLLRVCTGIREAYDLEKKTDTYPWEQYLQTPIAYAPKK